MVSWSLSGVSLGTQEQAECWIWSQEGSCPTDRGLCSGLFSCLLLMETEQSLSAVECIQSRDPSCSAWVLYSCGILPLTEGLHVLGVPAQLQVQGRCYTDSSEPNCELTSSAVVASTGWMIALTTPTLAYLPLLSLICLCFTTTGLIWIFYFCSWFP